MKTVVNLKRKRASETGSALVYILIAIALLALLTISFMEPSSQQTSSQNTFKTVSSLQGQVDVIRAAIQECVLIYPKGDPTIDTTGSGSDPGADDRYPINPDSTHYNSATPGRSGDRLVRNMRCPGNPTTVNAYDHGRVFTGASGKFLGPAPDLFGDWQIYNGADGVFYWITTDKTDAFVLSALDKLDEKFSECEADVVDASGGDVDMDSDTPNQAVCAEDNICFRVWMINNASAPHGDYATDNTCGASDI